MQKIFTVNQSGLTVLTGGGTQALAAHGTGRVCAFVVSVCVSGPFPEQREAAAQTAKLHSDAREGAIFRLHGRFASAPRTVDEETRCGGNISW